MVLTIPVFGYILRCMLTGELVEHLAAAFQIPTGTVLDAGKSLRAAGMLSKNGRGPRSGAQMTERDIVNWSLALILDKPRGADISDSVRHCRDLHTADMMRLGLDNVNGFFSATPGLALESIIRNLRPGGSLRDWSNGEPFQVSACIGTRGDTVITSFRPDDVAEKGPRVAMQTFGRDFDADAPVKRSVDLSRKWFEQMAEALGPPP